ncbi:MAG: hypothetical protein KBC73_17215 [Burkholderiaceae bacterium]|nr:hypothetical protein [Burkholderiaceae bacterium]
MRRFWPLALLWPALVLAAGTVPDEAAERSRIQAERQAVQTRFAQAERDCASRFQATACLEAARAQRREALDRLRREESVLDEARRRQRAAERLAQVQRRQREQAAGELLGQPPGRAAAAASNAAAASAAQSASRPAAATRPPVVADPGEAERRRRAYQERLQQAEAHARALRQRNAARDAERPPAAPLPVPGASAAPR